MTSFCMEKFVLVFCCLVWFCVLLFLFLFWWRVGCLVFFYFEWLSQSLEFFYQGQIPAPTSNLLLCSCRSRQLPQLSVPWPLKHSKWCCALANCCYKNTQQCVWTQISLLPASRKSKLQITPMQLCSSSSSFTFAKLICSNLISWLKLLEITTIKTKIIFRFLLSLYLFHFRSSLSS